MADPRFIEESDIIGGLDERPNLLAMSPTEFEGLIQNLFSRMGLDTRQTRASRDGGVDCVAVDPRPIMGGKVVIQAKRYRHTVGVSAVRDLYGTLQNEGASKGILVTTSGYGTASHEFANGKPIELLDGANLLYLLREHAGLEARIEAPDDWRDPEPDRAPLRDEQPAPAPPRVQLRPGQNVALDDVALSIAISWRRGAHDLDASAIVLNRSGRVRSDADFVFYNQPTTPDGAIRHSAATPGGASAIETLDIALNGLPLDNHRVVAAVSVDGGRFADVHDLRVTATTTNPATEYVFQPAATVETALVCLEIYRRDATWRLRAVGQGYADGLAGLARDFGVDVA
jgi:stress response protein SCP2